MWKSGVFSFLDFFQVLNTFLCISHLEPLYLKFCISSWSSNCSASLVVSKLPGDALLEKSIAMFTTSGRDNKQLIKIVLANRKRRLDGIYIDN